jgi:RNA polymerase sigma-70 factor (ECF subfamily)
MMNVQEVTAISERREGTPQSTPEAASTDERLLVAQARTSRSSAFGVLYERHRLRIHRTALRILRNQEDAEDVAQRAFQRAFTNLDRFRGDSAFSTWVTRIAINEALMLLRQRRTNTTLSGDNSHGDGGRPIFDPADKGPTPEEAFAESERRAAVLQAISQLRESLRVVVLFRELQGLTSVETARRLGLSVAAVKARTFHAKRHLRRHLERRLHATRSRCLFEKRNTQNHLRSLA